MPEIAEVERARTILEQILKNQKILDVEAFDDPLVFKDTTAKEFATTIKGKKVVGVKRWGKYFWIEMEAPPHPVLHFGWIRVRGVPTHYYPTKDENTWPPRFVKFILKIAEPETRPTFKGSIIPDIWGTEMAFVDARRLGRIRLVDAKDPFTEPPLNELGFDPVLNMPDFDAFVTGVMKRKVPIKALLLDQSFSAGVGNWVADEVLYQSYIHPEQYCNTIPNSALKTLHGKIHSVASIACSVLGDSSQFPEDWLFSYRWGKSRRKGKKGDEESNTLPNGEKIKHITVGGRTSAVVESRQKKFKTGGDTGGDEEESPASKQSREAKENEDVKAKTAARKVTKKKEKDVKKREKGEAEEEAEDEMETPKKRRISGKKETKARSDELVTRKSPRRKA